MSRKTIISFIALLASFQMALAQPYDRVVKSNLWNDGANVNGIRQDSVSVSYAELYGAYEGGEFRDTWQAEHMWKTGAVAKTILHLDRFSMKGDFAFEHMNGYGMCGSMFITPGLYPVDILEFTPGVKTRQTYSFYGGVAVEIARGWRLGADVDFEAANYSKRKDLRHSNYRLDMTVAPSLMYSDKNWAIGLSYIFSKNSETVKAEQVGVEESSYYAFLDKGLMYGVYEMWKGSGLHLSEAGISGFPVKEFIHGASVQGSYKDFYADLTYRYSFGTIGEKQAVWFNFPGHSIGVQLAYRMRLPEGNLFYRAAFDWRRQINRENILEELSSDGVTVTVSRGSRNLFFVESYAFRPQVAYLGGMWDVSGGVDVSVERSISALYYPLSYTQNMLNWSVWADMKVSLGDFDVGVKAAYAAGKHNTYERSSADIQPEELPFRLEDYHLLKNEYRTAGRIDLGMSCRWNFWRGIYAEVQVQWQRGFALEYINGPNRYGAVLKLGYNF